MNKKFIIIDAIRISRDYCGSTGDNASGKKDKKNTSGKGDLYDIPLKDFYDIAGSEYPDTTFISFHQTTLMDVLNLFYLSYKIKIDGYFIGIDINGNDNKDSTFSLSMKLSRTVEKKIPVIIELVKKNIMSLTG